MITPQPIPLDQAKAPKLLDQVRDKIRLKHYSIRTVTGKSRLGNSNPTRCMTLRLYA